MASDAAFEDSSSLTTDKRCLLLNVRCKVSLGLFGSGCAMKEEGENCNTSTAFLRFSLSVS